MSAALPTVLHWPTLLVLLHVIFQNLSDAPPRPRLPQFKSLYLDAFLPTCLDVTAQAAWTLLSVLDLWIGISINFGSFWSLCSTNILLHFLCESQYTFLLKIYFIFFIYVCIRMCIYALCLGKDGGTLWGQKKVSVPQELDRVTKAVVSCLA